MTRKRISKRIAKHAKTYKGGATGSVSIYNTTHDTYQTLIEKMNDNLNLNVRNEGMGRITGVGCLEYLINMATDLEGRHEFIKRNEVLTAQRMSHFRGSVTEVRLNYTQLVNNFKINDPEITFQIILGCIQFLYINMCDLLSYLPVGIFKYYEKYLINKTELFAKEIETLKQIEHIENRMMEDGKPYTPIKIGDNLELYRYWKEHKNDNVEIKISTQDIQMFIDCKNWRRTLIKTKKTITFIDYFEKDDACKKAGEKADAHKTAKHEQNEMQISKQKAEDAEDEDKDNAKKSRKETGTSI